MTDRRSHVDDRPARAPGVGTPVGIGIGVGAGIGLILGTLVDEVALGLTVGAGLGVVVGAASDTVTRRRGREGWVVAGVAAAILVAGLVAIRVVLR